jgi:endonuclease YncB( thermonuclease family)
MFLINWFRAFLAVSFLQGHAFAQVPPEPVKAGPWIKLENCSPVPWEHNDGDSFKVRTEAGEEFVARLYFVDAPEQDLSFPDRVKEQADYFGLSVSRTLEVAKEATAFVEETLSKKFTVWTRWRLGGGRGTRWAVMIQTHEGRWLCEELTRAGLVRVHGTRTPPPEETGAADSRAWRERLHKAEAEAKEAGRGGWSSLSE